MSTFEQFKREWKETLNWFDETSNFAQAQIKSLLTEDDEDDEFIVPIRLIAPDDWEYDEYGEPQWVVMEISNPVRDLVTEISEKATEARDAIRERIAKAEARISAKREAQLLATARARTQFSINNFIETLVS